MATAAQPTRIDQTIATVLATLTTTFKLGAVPKLTVDGRVTLSPEDTLRLAGVGELAIRRILNPSRKVGARKGHGPGGSDRFSNVPKATKALRPSEAERTIAKLPAFQRAVYDGMKFIAEHRIGRDGNEWISLGDFRQVPSAKSKACAKVASKGADSIRKAVYELMASGLVESNGRDRATARYQLAV